MGIFSRAKKSIKRISRGKFHLNPLKNGVHSFADPVTYSWFRLLPAHKQRRIIKAIDWGRFKKKYLSRMLGAGNNNASSVYVSSGGYVPGGYVYQGRRLGEMM